MRMILMVLVLAGCSSTGSPGEQGFRSSSSTEALDQAATPAAYVPTRTVPTPMAGISRRCTPLPNGLGADCRTLP